MKKKIREKYKKLRELITPEKQHSSNTKSRKKDLRK